MCKVTEGAECRQGPEPHAAQPGLQGASYTALWGDFQKDFYLELYQVFSFHTRPCTAFLGMPPAVSRKLLSCSMLLYTPDWTFENGYWKEGEVSLYRITEGLVYKHPLVFRCQRLRSKKKSWLFKKTD